MKRKRIVPLILLVGLSLAIWIGAFVVAQSENVTFEDPMLEQAMREELQIEEGEPIKQEDIFAASSLNLSSMQITNLEGLQKFENLTSLNLSDNKITDITHIGSLERLEDLNLENNQVTDLAPLENNSSLASLNIRENNVSSLEPLLELIYLTELNVRENRIVDVEPLRSLSQLEDVNLRYNEISSIEPIIELPLLRDRIYVDGNPLDDALLLSAIYDEVNDIDIPRPEYTIEFSEEPGVQPEPIEVELTTAGDLDGIIRYSTDNSEVTEESPVYSNPLTLEENANLRAKFFPSNGEPTNEYGNSYIIQEDSTLPIIAISTDERNLYDEQYGIYVPGIYYDEDRPNQTGNYMQSGQEWERPVFMQMFDPDEGTVLSQHAGIRIHGGQSSTVDRKSLRFYARQEYGEPRFEHALFGDDERDIFNRFILRNSGQDWNRTLFRDAMMQELVSDLNMETQLYQPITLYVNGESWGIYNIRERYDHHYFRFAHNVQQEHLDYLEKNGEVIEGTNEDYKQLLAYIRENGVESDQNLDVVSQEMDLDNFLDYYISQIYFGNTDWPHNNIDFWRERPNGKWRWLLYDTDFGFSLPASGRNAAHNTLAWATGEAREAWSTFLFSSLLENEDFRNEFIQRSAQYLNTNFNPETVVSTIDDMADTIAPEIPAHIERWGEPASIENWEGQVNSLRTFANDRPMYLRNHYANEFNLNGTAEMTIEDISESQLTISNQTFEAYEGWSGHYYTDTPLNMQIEGHDNSNIEIQSSNENVATINSENEVILQEQGEATVSFTTTEGDHLLTVTFNVEHLPDQHSLTLEANDTGQFELENVTNYRTSDSTILTVDSDGNYETDRAGRVTVSGFNDANDLVATFDVLVIDTITDEEEIVAGDRAIFYEGEWERVSPRESGFSYKTSSSGDLATFTFEGTGFQWYGMQGGEHGMANVYINDELVDTVDTYGETSSHELLYEISNLNHDVHEVVIEVTDEKNTSSKGQSVYINSFSFE
ncbi:hypothetical protein DH09_10650 [Bacillaceae bacterium JMAK1]|nr:hypothetical protein DH09_10650 [Bacillaceae bacterium JMAK1]